MSLDENCAIMRQVQADARRRYLARIDRLLAKRTDALGDLYRAGLDASADTRAARREHRLTAERGGGPGSYQRGFCGGYHATCSCGAWHGEPTASKRVAEFDAERERDHLFRPLSAGPIAHSPMVAKLKGVA